jgi:hypothetical protein
LNPQKKKGKLRKLKITAPAATVLLLTPLANAAPETPGFDFKELMDASAELPTLLQEFKPKREKLLF